MTSLKIGEILKYIRTGGFFQVKKITNDFVILHDREGSTQIMTGRRGLEYIFARVPLLEFPGRDMNSALKYPVPIRGVK